MQEMAISTIFGKHRTSHMSVLIVSCLLLLCLIPQRIQGTSIDAVKQEGALKTTTKEAFNRVEPILRVLKPGTRIEDSGLPLTRGVIKSERGFLWKESIVSDVWAQSDGWIGVLSGGTAGAMDTIGVPIGRSEKTVFGEHVYGYVLWNATIFPRYVVRTQADIVSKTEYEETLRRYRTKKGEPWPCRFRSPGREGAFIYCANVTIRDVIPLDFQEPPMDAQLTKMPFEPENFVAKYVAEYLSPEVYMEIEGKVNTLPKGLVRFEVVRQLGGFIVTRDYLLKDFMIYGVRGLLNDREDWLWEHVTPQGIFSVWPFGYMEEGKGVPKLMLIFKNGEVFKVVPYATRAEIEKHFQ